VSTPHFVLVNKFIFEKIKNKKNVFRLMVNKKKGNKIFFRALQTLIFVKKSKKKKRERWEKKGISKFVFNYHTPSHEPNNLTYFCPHSLLFYHLFLIEKIMI